MNSNRRSLRERNHFVSLQLPQDSFSSRKAVHSALSLGILFATSWQTARIAENTLPQNAMGCVRLCPSPTTLPLNPELKTTKFRKASFCLLHLSTLNTLVCFSTRTSPNNIICLTRKMLLQRVLHSYKAAKTPDKRTTN